MDGARKMDGAKTSLKCVSLDERYIEFLEDRVGHYNSLIRPTSSEELEDYVSFLEDIFLREGELDDDYEFFCTPTENEVDKLRKEYNVSPKCKEMKGGKGVTYAVIIHYDDNFDVSEAFYYNHKNLNDRLHTELLDEDDLKKIRSSIFLPMKQKILPPPQYLYVRVESDNPNLDRDELIKFYRDISNINAYCRDRKPKKTVSNRR